MLDTRFHFERLQSTETVCDKCEQTILESEQRFLLEISINTNEEPMHSMIICSSCSGSITVNQ